jgi:hypothetical protein
MLNQVRANPGGVSVLTSVRTPIVVYGIPVPSGNQQLANLVRYVGRLCMIIAMLETIHFVMVMLSEPELQPGRQEAKVANGAISLLVFGFLVPACGYVGAKNRDKGSLTMFCFGEGLVAGCGGCTLIFAVLATIAFSSMCSSPECVAAFQNASSMSALCNTTLDSAGSPSQRVSISKLDCEDHGDATAWASLLVSVLLVILGLEGMRQAMSLREKYHNLTITNMSQQPTSLVATVPVRQSQVVMVTRVGGSGATSPSALPMGAVVPGEQSGGFGDEEVPTATAVTVQ